MRASLGILIPVKEWKKICWWSLPDQIQENSDCSLLLKWFCTLLCQGGDFSVIKSFLEHSRPSSGIDREGVFLILGLIPGGGRIWREAYPEWGLSRDVGAVLCLGLGPPRGDCSSTRWAPFLLSFERQRKQGLVNMFQEAAILRALLLFL